jgi:hypothetical protein
LWVCLDDQFEKRDRKKTNHKPHHHKPASQEWVPPQFRGETGRTPGCGKLDEGGDAVLRHMQSFESLGVAKNRVVHRHRRLRELIEGTRTDRKRVEGISAGIRE